MRLFHVIIRNFRCIGEFEIWPKDFTSLIGPNNSGKSSALRAIEIVLNQESPSPDEWPKGRDNQPIQIEVAFDEIQGWERSTPGVASHVFKDNVRLRMTASLSYDANGKPKVTQSWESFRCEESIQGWDDNATFTKLDAELQSLARTNDITAKSFAGQGAKEKLRSLIREQLPDRVTLGEPLWSSAGISIPNALQQAIPQAQLIPAVRDANDDCQPGKTSFGALLEKIILPAIIGSDEYKNVISSVDTLRTKLRSRAEDQIETVKLLLQEITASLSQLILATVFLDLDPPDAKKFIGANTLLQLDDGTPTRIGLQGHGLQRALIFAMLEVLATKSAVKTITDSDQTNRRQTVLLFEEPELFIHPHLMRRLRDTLTKIASRPDWQVVVSTHSPFLVDVASDPCSLVIHRRSSSSRPPGVKQLRIDPLAGEKRKDERQRLRALLDFHPTVCEAFFAKHVVLVEGDTELAVFSKPQTVCRLAGISDEQTRDVTIVSCNGKWTIIPIARLLCAFGIPTRVVHDCDRKGRSDEKLSELKTSEFHANAKIAEVVPGGDVFVVDDTFEHVLWDKTKKTYRTKKDKPFRAWKRVRVLCKKKENLDHAPALKRVIEFVFRPFPDSLDASQDVADGDAPIQSTDQTASPEC